MGRFDGEPPSTYEATRSMNERLKLGTAKRGVNVRLWGAPCKGGAF